MLLDVPAVAARTSRKVGGVPFAFLDVPAVATRTSRFLDVQTMTMVP